MRELGHNRARFTLVAGSRGESGSSISDRLQSRGLRPTSGAVGNRGRYGIGRSDQSRLPRSPLDAV
ncbi:MAG TPA: hypothetical protein VN973_14820 [Candidatus Dormibacteraeota bacterium]|nr:hypothetical protein [Candidatus Dormibacteraeota bacterium]